MAGVDPDHEVDNRSIDFAKPMWRACGNDDNVALFKFMVHTALYCRARYARPSSRVTSMLSAALVFGLITVPPVTSVPEPFITW